MGHNRRRNHGADTTVLNELETSTTIPLTMVETGGRVHLVGIDAGRRLQARLAEMGLVPGIEIEVINNTFRGPFIIGVKGSRIVLGRGMAMKIFVV